MKKIIIGLIVLIIFGGSFYLAQEVRKIQSPKENTDSLIWDGSWQVYRSKDYPLSIEYPSYLAFDDSAKNSIIFGTREKSGELSPYNGGMGVKIEETDSSSAQEWFKKHKDDQAPFATLILEKELTIDGYSAILARHAEIADDKSLTPGVEQKVVLVRGTMLILINGAGIDFERVMGGLKFN